MAVLTLAGTLLYARGGIGGGDIKLAIAASGMLCYPLCVPFLLIHRHRRRAARDRLSRSARGDARAAFSRTVALDAARRCRRVAAEKEQTLPYARRVCLRRRARRALAERRSILKDNAVMNIRRTTLLIAIILAVGTGWLTLTYLSSLRPPANQPRPVLIATQEIPARERITASMFQSEMRPAQSLQPDALSDPTQALGSLALITIPAGSQLTASTVGNNVGVRPSGASAARHARGQHPGGSRERRLRIDSARRSR